MTPAEHAALSAQLARAIGWRLIDIAGFHGQEPPSVMFGPGLFVWFGNKPDQYWRKFDYRDPSVAMGVLEWLIREHGAAVPRTADNTRISVVCRLPGEWGVGDTLPEAIARAAIAVADAKRQRVEQNEAREVLQP